MSQAKVFGGEARITGGGKEEKRREKRKKREEKRERVLLTHTHRQSV
jgi:hypothetical protein